MAQRQTTTVYDKSQPLGFRTESRPASDSESVGPERAATFGRDHGEEDDESPPHSPDAPRDKKERKKLEKEMKKEEKRAKELEKETKKQKEKEEKAQKKLEKAMEKADKPHKDGVVATIATKIKSVAPIGKKKAGGGDECRALHIFRGENEYRIKVFVGTPVEEILQTVLREAGMEGNRKVRFIDAEGFSVVLSSHLPDGTRLYMQILDDLPNPEPVALGWAWDLSSRSCRKHTVTGDGKTLGQNGNYGFGGIRSTQIFTEGLHYWTILFNPLQCCVAGGVVAPDEIVGLGGGSENPFLPTFAFSGALLGSFESEGGNSEPTECGFLLNMDDGTLRVYNLTKGETRCRLFLDCLPSAVYAAVVLKHITTSTITGSAKDPPSHLLVSSEDARRHPRLLPCSFKGHFED
eukprot:TRINITY_DN16986_c0_g1_i1.p1 TRINITY_DN16986_c0_g1~~TRINITY_DN16986_c0_g1_i1.p1  ORF type:complete len:418 (+),score=107.93 TRINITY_DN16986_c0_g1_i1:36-1256(+)